MDNPYWTSDGQEHYVNLVNVKSLSFEIVNIFEASKSLAEEMAASEYADDEVATIEKFPLMGLHQELSFKKSSELLLQLSILVRTYDDQMKNSIRSEEYNAFADQNDSGNYIGVLEGREKFFLREACNKIIHAQQVRPLYERADQYIEKSEGSDLGQDIWYLTGEIELYGKLREREWNAVVYTQPFLETILGLIQFGYPTN